MLNGLDLFSGIGGLTLALADWVNPIAYCESEPYAQAVLLSRMHEGKLPQCPIWNDVRSLRGKDFLGGIDIIYGGFPCQDISIARNGAGLGGERSGLYWELHRLTEEIQPAFVFLENVPAIRTRGLKELVWSLSDLRYDCRWTCLSAAELGAPHRRNRWFLLAHTKREQLRYESGGGRGPGREGSSITPNNGAKESLANPNETGCRIDKEANAWKECIQGWDASSHRDWWAVEPDVDRVADGVPNRMDRIRSLGNSVVPVQAKTAFERLMGIK